MHTLTNFPEVEVQEVDEEPSESFKKELQEHFDEQVKVEGKSSDCKPYHINLIVESLASYKCIIVG